MAKRLEKKHPLAIRWLHWINFPLLFLMIWSGLLIYWANAVYGIKIFGYELFHFFPAWFYEIYKIDFWGYKIPDYLPAWSYEWMSIPFRLADGLQMHFFLMWFFIVNGVLYVLYTAFSGEWRALLPVPGSLKRALQVTLYDFKLSRYHPPQGKYNDAQRIAYTSAILMGVGSTLTGLAIYKPTQLAWLTTIFGGYEWARWAHLWLTVFFVLFFLVHIAQVVKAGWNNFRSMITGFEMTTADKVKIEKDLPETMTPAEKGAI